LDERPETAGNQPATELREWYLLRFRPRLARAVRLGVADPRRAAALDGDLHELIGGGAESPSQEAARLDSSRTAA
jgi:hypothetical protein